MIALVGNKLDLEPNRAVDETEASTYAEENGLLFFEASAKTGSCVNDIFQGIAIKVPKIEQVKPTRPDLSVHLTGAPDRRANCC